MGAGWAMRKTIVWKRAAGITAAAALAAMVLTGCAGRSSASGGQSEEASTEASTEDAQVLHVFQSDTGMDQALKDLAERYEKDTGTEVVIQTMGGDIDLEKTLQVYEDDGNMPDIFVCENADDFAAWTDDIEDLSGEAWADNTDLAYTDVDGKVLGFPFNAEGYGLVYNAQVLEEAGVDPASITDEESLAAALETIDAMKGELGLGVVVGYYADAESMYEATGDRLFGVYEYAGLSPDDTTYSDLLQNGNIAAIRFGRYSSMIELFNEYSDPESRVSGTYDQQLEGFASGWYAFLPAGTDTIADMMNGYEEAYKATGHFQMGILPFTFDEGIDTIQVRAGSWWAVNKNGNAEEAKKFLSWCAEDQAQRVLANSASYTSPFRTGAPLVYTNPVSTAVSAYIKNGKISALIPAGEDETAARQAIARVYRRFASGALTQGQFMYRIRTICNQYYGQE